MRKRTVRGDLTGGSHINAKIVIPSNTELVNVIGEMAGILPWSKAPAPAKP